MGSVGELTDAGVSTRTKKAMTDSLLPLVSSSSSSPSSSSIPDPSVPILGISDLRARRAGSLTFVELTADVPAALTVSDTAALERRITATLREARREVAEVRVRFRPVSSDAP
jgi:divalent metal cation (Fe/Co/Zn/Cd) transporter